MVGHQWRVSMYGHVGAGGFVKASNPLEISGFLREKILENNSKLRLFLFSSSVSQRKKKKTDQIYIFSVN